MRLTLKRRKELDELVSSFCSENKLDVKNDVIGSLYKIGFKVYSARFKRELAGMILVDENVNKLEKFDSNKIILYNEKFNYYEVRFILLHELAHYISRKFVEKDAKLLFAVRDHNEEYHEDVEEQEMDYMAASMLVPTSELQLKIEEYVSKNDFSNVNIVSTLQNDEYFIQMLQREYKVEKILARRRIGEVLEGQE